MIGWERPPLDELGCSNGTFVYGYRVGRIKYSSRQSDTCTFGRFVQKLLFLIVLVTSQVFVDGAFHKSVMSSACTKVLSLPTTLNSRPLLYPVKLNSNNSCTAYFVSLSSVRSGESGPECLSPHQCPNAGLEWS